MAEENKRTRPPNSGGNKKGKKESFGSISKLPSKRYRARYKVPGNATYYAAPTTFTTLGDARAWLSLQQSEITLNKWKPPQNESMATFADYSQTWLKDRDLKPRTRSHYAALLENRLLPQFGKYRPAQITPDSIRNWHASFGEETPTLRSHCYGLLRTILGTAVEDDLIEANPCHIRGAGRTKKVHKTEPATLPQLAKIVEAMPEGYKMMTLLAAWCALRFGELVELRRKDIDLSKGIIHVRRGAVRVDGEIVIGSPKSAAGTRDVAIPPHLIPLLKEHIGGDISGNKEGLLFPAVFGGTLHPSTLYTHFYKARETAGRSDLRFHDLRHTGAVLAASTGATLAELMGRLGHSSPAAALQYQHAAAGRDLAIARALTTLALAEGKLR